MVCRIEPFKPIVSGRRGVFLIFMDLTDLHSLGRENLTKFKGSQTSPALVGIRGSLNEPEFMNLFFLVLKTNLFPREFIFKTYVSLARGRPLLHGSSSGKHTYSGQHSSTRWSQCNLSTCFKLCMWLSAFLNQACMRDSPSPPNWRWHRRVHAMCILSLDFLSSPLSGLYFRHFPAPFFPTHTLYPELFNPSPFSTGENESDSFWAWVKLLDAKRRGVFRLRLDGFAQHTADNVDPHL